VQRLDEDVGASRTMASLGFHRKKAEAQRVRDGKPAVDIALKPPYHVSCSPTVSLQSPCHHSCPCPLPITSNLGTLPRFIPPQPVHFQTKTCPSTLEKKLMSTNPVYPLSAYWTVPIFCLVRVLFGSAECAPLHSSYPRGELTSGFKTSHVLATNVAQTQQWGDASIVGQV
jgi:hypothetical protein